MSLSTLLKPTTPSVKQPRRSIRYALRWLVAIVLGLVAFNQSVERTVEYFHYGAAAYSLTMLLAVLVLLVGIDRQRVKQLPIHDREVDYIIGSIAIIISMTIEWQLVARFADWYFLLRFDLLAVVVWTFGASVLLFGTRATLQYSRIWLLLLVFNPPVFLFIGLIAGGNWWGSVIASAIILSVAGFLAIGGKTLLRLAFGLAVFIGNILVAFPVVVILPEKPIQTAQIPAVIVVVFLLFLSNWKLFSRIASRSATKATAGHPEKSAPLISPTVKDTKIAIAILAVSSIVIAAYPLPKVQFEEIPSGPIYSSTPGIDVPAGWVQLEEDNMSWASTFFGEGSTLIHQEIESDFGLVDNDGINAEHRVVVDTLHSDSIYRIEMFNKQMLYSTINGRQSRPIQVDLGHGVTGSVYTIVDEDKYQTSTRLDFDWNREGDVIESVSIITVDEAVDYSSFPQLSPSFSNVLLRIVTIFLRGNAVTVDESSTYRNLEVVSSVGRSIVEETWRDHD
ncbi:hypothetical protein [Corynebacterium alimapuense]|uniref:Uncharacterized protein n=1 Tax=Corynebacterium alimapuense TaxID=1576874 RepID=A0A3M8K930_9CORY|nr:hypothetical protein [Corynebacterium alimapuense]RNE49389.1 hypothetical protein C5L39_03205 [Corynebacterium alimapuense]